MSHTITGLFALTAVSLSACQTAALPNNTIRLEAETGFTNLADVPFEREERDFYSGGAVILIGGAAEIGASGLIEYDLSGRVPPGTYRLKVTYNDENDGHSPVMIWLDDQSFSFVMDAATLSAFPNPENQRSAQFKSVAVGEASVLRVRGTVDRYQSEHRELVRLDYFEFTPAIAGRQ